MTDDGDFTTSTSILHAQWSAAADAESGISGSQYAIGTTAGGTQVLNWTSTTALEATPTELSLDTTGSTTYYFAVRAMNGAGMTSDPVGVSDGITCQPQKVIHVKWNSPNNGPGNDWDHAYHSVQAGINAASSSQEVWVAAGTYSPQSTISITSGVALYGGFEGTELVRIDRNWEDHETILDGGNARTVVSVASAPTRVTLDGFTVRNGSSVYPLYGGGIDARWSPITLSHNRMVGNSGEVGGGVYCDSCDSLVIADNLIAGNSALLGEGVYLYQPSGIVANNTIVGNTGGQYGTGGGLYCVQPSSFVIANNIMAYNADSGVRAINGGVLVRNCSYGNSGSQYGGLVPPLGNISVAPLFFSEGAGDYRLGSESPCRNAGANDRAQNALDLDAHHRIQGGTVDMGAYEFPDGVLYDVSLALGTNPVAAGSQVTATATVTDPLNGPVSYAQVHFSSQGGSVSPSQVTAYASGVAQATVTRTGAGIVTVTASVYVERCETWTTKTASVYFYGTEALASDWPMFMHDAQHTGASPESDTAPETLTLAWEATAPTASTERTWGTWSVNAVYHRNPAGGYTHIFEHPYIDSSPIVVGNVVVIGTWGSGDYLSSTGSVRAFDAETGALKWEADDNHAMGGVASTPCFYGGRVFVGSANGYLYCLDVASGTQLWAQPTSDRSSGQSKILASPVVHDGIVYIGNEAAKIYAFDTAGTLQQGYPVILPIDSTGHDITDVDQQNICGVSSPAVATVDDVDYLLFGCDDGWLYRLRLSDQNLACANLGACVESSPTVVGDEAFVGVTRDYGHNMYRVSVGSLQAASAQVGYSGPECRGTPAYGFSHLYVGVDTGHTFHKLVPATLANAQGSTPFDSSLFPETGYYVGSAALSAAGVAYVGNDNGCLYALSTTDLSVITSYAPELVDAVCSSPAIAYNVDAGRPRWVYVVSRVDGGRLWAFRTAR